MFKPILILSSHIHMDLPNGLFPTGYAKKDFALSPIDP
jgi:hypothetical protein